MTTSLYYYFFYIFLKFQYHQMSHEGSKTFICDICQKVFANPRQLYCHRALHLGKRFLCSQCGYRARSATNLRSHVKTKHQGKQFECSFCYKKFGSANNLRNHVSNNLFYLIKLKFYWEILNFLNWNFKKYQKKNHKLISKEWYYFCVILFNQYKITLGNNVPQFFYL